MYLHWAFGSIFVDYLNNIVHVHANLLLSVSPADAKLLNPGPVALLYGN